MIRLKYFYNTKGWPKKRVRISTQDNGCNWSYKELVVHLVSGGPEFLRLRCSLIGFKNNKTPGQRNTINGPSVNQQGLILFAKPFKLHLVFFILKI